MPKNHRSFSEVDSTVSKACRGVDLPPGLDEEIGRAAKAICRTTGDHLSAFADALEDYDKGASGAPNIDRAAQGLFQAMQKGQHLSALLAGPAAVDLLLADAVPNIRLEDMDQPLVLLGIMLQVSAFRDDRLDLLSDRTQSLNPLASCQTGQILVWPQSFPSGDLILKKSADDPELAAVQPGMEGIEIDDETWRRLTTLANRMLVEASDASRMAGAGAGLLDND
ncbi:MAG: hypothetical protein AAF530_21055 [Pseudomonadota bacterium]